MDLILPLRIDLGHTEYLRLDRNGSCPYTMLPKRIRIPITMARHPVTNPNGTPKALTEIRTLPRFSLDRSLWYSGCPCDPVMIPLPLRLRCKPAAPAIYRVWFPCSKLAFAPRHINSRGWFNMDISVPVYPNRLETNPIPKLQSLMDKVTVTAWRLFLQTPHIHATTPMIRGVWGRALRRVDRSLYDRIFAGANQQGHNLPRYILRPAPPDPNTAPAIDWILLGIIYLSAHGDLPILNYCQKLQLFGIFVVYLGTQTQ